MVFSKAALTSASAFLLAASISTLAGCQYNKCASSGSCCGACEGGGGCKSECKDKGECQAGEKQALNKICPIGGHDADGTITASHKGKTVSFCCDGCKTDFASGTDAQRDEIVAKAYAAK